MPHQGFVFRKAALERLSTPEQLDQLIRVTRPRSWILLTGLLTLVAAFLLWGIFGTLTLRVEGHGVIVEDPEGLQAVVYIAARDRKRVEPGMEVLIAPATLRPEVAGYMKGRVAEVADRPAPTQRIAAVLQNDRRLAGLDGLDVPYEVQIELLRDPASPDAYAWTASAVPPGGVRPGTPCTVRITSARRRPFSLVVPGLDETE